MKLRLRAAVLVAFLSSIAISGLGQSTQKETGDSPKGSIAGTVTIGGNAAARIPVLLLRDPYNPPIARTTADAAGHFRFDAVTSGRYVMGVIASVYCLPDQTEDGQPGKSVSVKDGEQVGGIDLSLVPGGVITGRVTDQDGLPVSGQDVDLELIDHDGKRLPVLRNYGYEFQTDDRGIYRIYGLAPGRYRVSVGRDPTARSAVGSKTYYARRFYPSTPDPGKAVPVDVTSGDEATSIDIALGKASSAYNVTGRVVDADTGKACPRTGIGWGYTDVRTVDGSTSRTGSWSTGGQSDDGGNFHLDALMPGRYSAWAIVEDGDSGGYGEPATLEITDHDLAGVELNVSHGLSLSGTVVVDGEAGAAASTGFHGLELFADYSFTADDPLGGSSRGRKALIAPDGSFMITGLRPGKIGLLLQTQYVPGPQGPSRTSPQFWIVRIEGPGAVVHESGTAVPSRFEYQDAIEIPEGTSLSGLRVILSRATAAVRGLVKIQGGELPAGVRLQVFYTRLSASDRPQNYGADVDVNGRFSIDALAAGQYEFSTRAVPANYRAPWPDLPVGRQTVTLADGQPSDVTLVIDLTGKDKSKDQ
jgi:hypothetical protein